MRDFAGINAALVPTDPEDLQRYLPVLRRDLSHLDYFLRDLSRGMQRIEVGQVPNGSGDTIINQVVSDRYWFKPGDSPFGTAFMDTASGGTGIISSTAHTTKGFVYLGSSTGLTYDETNVRVGLSQATPTARLHMVVPPGLSYTAPSAVTATAGTSWSALPSGTLLAALDDRDTDPTGTDYARWTASLGNGTIQIDFPVMADPGAGVLFGFRVLLRASAGCQTRLLFTFGFGATVVTGNIVWGGPSNVDFTATNYQGNVTTAFIEYTFIMNSTDSATMRAGVAGGSPPRILVQNSGNVGTETFDVGYNSLTVSSTLAAETLHKWATTGSILDQLDFASDGASGTDLQLSGNAEFYVNTGDASTGLRFYGLSNTAYIEAGTTAQANMNLTLGGNRLSTGTLLTSNFTTQRFNGNIGVGATPATGIMFDLVGVLALRAASHTLTSSTNFAYALPAATFARINSPSGVRQINGITGGVDGRVVWWHDVGSVPYSFIHESSSATAANRIHISTQTNLTTSPDASFFLIYDATTQRWRLQKWAGPGESEHITGAWTFQNLTTVEVWGSGRLLLAGASSGFSPQIEFMDMDTGFTLNLTANNIPAGGQWILPDPGGIDTLVGRLTTDTLGNKTLGTTANVLLASTSGVGVAWQDATTSSKKLRHVLSGAVGTNTMTHVNTGARDHRFEDVPGTVAIVGNGADPPAADAVGKVDRTGAVADVAATLLTNACPAGEYLVYVDMECTTLAAGTGTVQFRMSYTNDVGAVTNEVVIGKILTSTGHAAGAAMVTLASGDITYNITNTGAYSTAVYACRARCVFIG